MLDGPNLGVSPIIQNKVDLNKLHLRHQTARRSKLLVREDHGCLRALKNQL